MKLLESDGEKFCFQVAARERLMLFRVLELYPLIPVAHHRLSKSEPRSDNQKMLEESFAQQREKNREQVQTLLKSDCFQHAENGWRLSLNRGQMEWLLQVLNDVRVGSWLIIGSPDGLEKTFAAINQQNASYFWAMQVAGGFQMALVEAMNG